MLVLILTLSEMECESQPTTGQDFNNGCDVPETHKAWGANSILSYQLIRRTYGHSTSNEVIVNVANASRFLQPSCLGSAR